MNSTKKLKYKYCIKCFIERITAPTMWGYYSTRKYRMNVMLQKKPFRRTIILNTFYFQSSFLESFIKRSTRSFSDLTLTLFHSKLYIRSSSLRKKSFCQTSSKTHNYTKKKKKNTRAPAAKDPTFPRRRAEVYLLYVDLPSLALKKKKWAAQKRSGKKRYTLLLALSLPPKSSEWKETPWKILSFV